ncbi:MAG: hypothetical protein KGJ59_00245, partial [Bacteroidota bacterium]|nr:hypothetical protein [Bacteroidota bacterium]
IGGSFGIAIMGTLLTQRMIYHTAMYGQAIDQNSPAFQRTAYMLGRFAQETVGGSLSTAMMRGKAILTSHLVQQSFVRAVDDDFLVAAAITFVGVIPIFILRTHKKKKGESIAAME